MQRNAIMKGLWITLVISVLTVFGLRAQNADLRDTLIQVEGEQINTLAFDPLDLEIQGLIIDETMTKVGRDFYEVFFSNWENPSSIQDFSILIKERPMPGIGTQIRVFIDEHEILSQFVRPNHEQIEMLATYTVGLASSYLLNYAEIQAQLMSEDQSGTGIF